MKKIPRKKKKAYKKFLKIYGLEKNWERIYTPANDIEGILQTSEIFDKLFKAIHND